MFQARDRAAEADQGVVVAYSIPSEGAEMWFDQMAIPADAPHVEEAHEFLNFIMRPEQAAKATNYVYYPNGNKASQEFIDKEILEDPAIYPDEATLAKLFTVSPYDRADAAHGDPRLDQDRHRPVTSVAAPAQPAPPAGGHRARDPREAI